jgi:ribosomal protein S17E
MQQACSISIILNGAINPVFIKANRYILKKYSKKFENLDLENKKKVLENLWELEYNIKLGKVSNSIKTAWTHMIFPDPSSKTMFMLKWE